MTVTRPTQDELQTMPLAEAQTIATELGLGFLHVTNHTGDTRIMWDPERPDEIEMARAAWDEARRKRYLAYSVQEDGSRGEVIPTSAGFPTQQGKLIMIPQPVGG